MSNLHYRKTTNPEIKTSNGILVSNIPTDWSEEVVGKKFAVFGQVKGVVIHVPPKESKEVNGFAVVEFDNSKSASNAVSEYRENINNITVTFHFARKSTSFLVEGSDKQKNVAVPNSQTIMCSNYNCPSMMVTNPDEGEIYCSVDCHCDFIGILTGQQKINITERSLCRIGRGGTGLLEDMDKIIVFCDCETGVRSIKWYQETTRSDRPNMQEARKQMLCKIAKTFAKTKVERKLRKVDNNQNQEKLANALRDKDIIRHSIPPIAYSPHLSLSQKQMVFVVFAVNPWEIYVHTKKSAIQAQKIRSICNAGISPEWKTPNWVPTVGKFCIASYNGECYRAKIVQISDEFIEVHYIDYGNVACVDIDEVSEMGLGLLQMVPQCFQCKLANVKPSAGRDYWNEASIQKIKSFENKYVWVDPLSVDLNGSNVLSRICEASEDGQIMADIGEQLIKTETAVYENVVGDVARKKILFEPDTLPAIEKRPLLPEKIITKVKICNVNSPSDFYVIEDVAEYANMKTRMTKHVMLKKIFLSPKKNEVCAAKMNNQWKRARKLNDDIEKIEVICIDDGIKGIVEALDVIKLKKDMLETPPLAIRCSLYNVQPLGDSWSAIAINRLKEIAESNESCFVEAIDLDHEKYFVKLLIDDTKEDFKTILLKCNLASEQMSCEEVKDNNMLNTDMIDTINISESDYSSETLTIKDIELIEENEIKKKLPKVQFHIDKMRYVKLKHDDLILVKNFVSFNRCFVQSFEGAEDLLDLQDRINEHITSAKTYKKLPMLGEVVLGCLRGSVQYIRGVVEEVITSSNVRIRFVDIGIDEILHYQDLRHVSAEIFKVPITGETVLLAGVSDGSLRILKSDFDTFCSRLSKNLRIEMIHGGGDTGIQECKLHYRLEKMKRSVNEEIIDLGKWKWEIAFGLGKLTDNDITQYERNGKLYYYDVKTVELPLNEEIEMKVTLYTDSSTFVCIPKIPSLERDLKVMETQMNLYLNTVKESLFFPAMSEVHFSKKEDGKWMRCTRFDYHGCLAIDYGTTFRIKENNVRLMSREFFNIPQFSVNCKLLIKGMSASKDNSTEKLIKGFLKPRRMIKCIVTAFCEDSNLYSIECDEVTKAFENSKNITERMEMLAVDVE